MKEKKTAASKADAMEQYIGEIDRFATMLRYDQDDIARLAAIMDEAKGRYDRAREDVKEAKDREHNTVTLLLKFIRPGSIDVMPLFDRMEPADDKAHGKHASEWRKEPISVLALSALATKILLDADIVLVGQLQDRVFKGTCLDPAWREAWPAITEGMAAGIEAKLIAYIDERTGAK